MNTEKVYAIHVYQNVLMFQSISVYVSDTQQFNKKIHSIDSIKVDTS